MYRWPHERGRIDRLPFIAVSDIGHDLAPVTGGRKPLSQPAVLLDEWDKEPAFLTVEQLKVARNRCALRPSGCCST